MLSLWCQVASGHFSTRGQFSLQPNCISNFNTLRSVFTPLFSNYLISTELWISGYIGSNAFRWIPVLHHLQIWWLPCLFKSIRSLIKEEKKTNRLTLVLQCPPPLIPQHPSGQDIVICHLPMFISQEPTFVCGQGWYPSVSPFVLWVKVMGRAISGPPVNPTLTISYNSRMFKLNGQKTSHIPS